MTRLFRPNNSPISEASPGDLEHIFRQHGLERDASVLAQLAFTAVAPAALAAQETRDKALGALELCAHGVAGLVRVLAPEPPATVLLAAAMELHHPTHGYPGLGSKPQDAVTAELVGILSRETRPAQLTVALGFIAGRTPQGWMPSYRSLFSALLRNGALDPLLAMDRERIKSTRKGVPGESWNQPEREGDPMLPDFWAALSPNATMAACEAMFRDEPITSLGVLALGVRRSLALDYSQGTRFLESLPAASILLCSRRTVESAMEDPLLTRCCWDYARRAFQESPEQLGAFGPPLRETALAELGRARSQLAPDADNTPSAVARFEYLEAGMFFVLRLDPTSFWDILRRLLLLLRALPKRCVPLDLRTWNEADLENLPEPWAWVPRQITAILELFLARELALDPGLEKLREELARFCLERLKTKKPHTGTTTPTNQDMVEPEPCWRQGYVHAAAVLFNNPGGRGHLVLAWSRDNDPDDEVRGEAKAAQEILRRSHGLPKDVSPRRPLYEAFWWLRQAHVVAMGEMPDESGAKRTFTKELRRTRELDAVV